MRSTPIYSSSYNYPFEDEKFDVRRFYEGLSEAGKENLQKTFKTYQELRNKGFSRPDIANTLGSEDLNLPSQEGWFSRNKNILLPAAGIAGAGTTLTLAGLLAYMLYKRYTNDKNKVKDKENKANLRKS